VPSGWRWYGAGWHAGYFDFPYGVVVA